MLHDVLPPELRTRRNDCCCVVVCSLGMYLVLPNFGRSMYLILAMNANCAGLVQFDALEEFGTSRLKSDQLLLQVCNILLISCA